MDRIFLGKGFEVLEKIFKLKAHNTNIKTESLAGLTTFLTMLYIVPVNALVLSSAGMPLDAIITATALITILSSIFNGLWSNTPIAMSVGMGINAYFSYVLVLGMGIPWQSALGLVFISGLIFLVLSFTKFRMWILSSIPMELRLAIGAGIGMFIAFIGLQQMGVIVKNQATIVGLGDLSDAHVLLGIFCLFLALFFSSFKIKGGFILAVIITSGISWGFGFAPLPSKFFSLPASISPIAFELDILSAFSLSLLPVVITFLVTNMFDSLGTISAIGSRAGIFNKKSDKSLEKALQADALSTTTAGLLGVSTTTAFIESLSGVEAGGRTGLTSVITGLLFISTLFLLPFFKAIPSFAIFPILVAVGILMFKEIGKIDFSNLDLATNTGVFFIISLMPLTYSITNGIAAGLSAFLIIKLVTGQFKSLNLGIVTVCVLSSLIFII